LLAPLAEEALGEDLPVDLQAVRKAIHRTHNTFSLQTAADPLVTNLMRSAGRLQGERPLAKL